MRRKIDILDPEAWAFSRAEDHARASAFPPKASGETLWSSRYRPRAAGFPDGEDTYHRSYVGVCFAGMLGIVEVALRTVDPMRRSRFLSSA